MKRCRYCHRRLKDEESIARGIGPVCYSRLGRKRKSPSKGAFPAADPEEAITIEEWYESQEGSVNDESVGHNDQGHSLCP